MRTRKWQTNECGFVCVCVCVGGGVRTLGAMDLLSLQPLNSGFRVLDRVRLRTQGPVIHGGVSSWSG
jgi:hypothetical protein